MKTEQELLQEINENLKRLMGVIAVQGSTDDIKITTLKKMGFNSTEISKMTGIHVSKIKRVWK